MHICTECKHTELKYCEQCDKVYCKCGKEWGGVTPYLYYQPFTYPGTTTVSHDTCDAPGDTANGLCSHT